MVYLYLASVLYVECVDVGGINTYNRFSAHLWGI